MMQRGDLDPYKPILQNIQNIRNSLDAVRMQQDIPNDLVDPDEEIAEEDEANFDDFRNTFATMFQNPNFVRLDAEPTHFECKCNDIPIPVDESVKTAVRKELLQPKSTFGFGQRTVTDLHVESVPQLSVA